MVFCHLQVDEEDLFNPDYIEVDRILDVAVTVDPVSNETVTHYLVTWRSLAYEDATWELEQDVEQNKINNFLKIRDPPSEEQSRVCVHFVRFVLVLIMKRHLLILNFCRFIFFALRLII